MQGARTPTEITNSIKLLCGQICPETEAIFMTIKPDPDCQPNDCFHCVRRKMERHGGRIQFGWAIWEWPRVFIEAEHHAVYEPPNGPPWIDITPSAVGGICHRLFLPDDTATYNYQCEGVRKDNIRMALSDDPLIQKLFSTSIEYNNILNAIPGIGMISVDRQTAGRLEYVMHENQLISQEIGMKYTSQNAPCFCGSGIKFKRCHGQRRGRR